MTDSTQSNAALASLLESRLMEWERARKPQELKMLECYQDVMRIPRDDDTSGTGTAKTKKTKSLFIGSTRNKVRAARAKINDALFGSGKLPFDTNPTDEELAPFADVVEDILTEQMERGRFKALLKSGVGTLPTFGTGFIFGPFVRKECLTEVSVDRSQGFDNLQEQKYEFDFPYFELANTLDVYPDPEAATIESGLGVFWATMESPHTVAAWKGRAGYSNIDQALIGAGDRGNETGGDIAHQMRANVDFWHKNNRIKVARFFGKIPAGAMAEQPDQDGVGKVIDAIVIMAGGVVVKVDKSPYGEKCPSMSCVYEAVEHELWGVGVAENNSPHQKVTNAAFRLFMEGKGMALLGTASVDRSKFLPTEDFRKYPGKVYQFKPGLSPEDRQAAIIHHIEPDITDGWMGVIQASEQMSDDDTGITKYTQGDDSSNLNKTASGISMIMSASSLPIKEVIQNIDEMWIEPVLERLIDWNLKYLDPETVEKIHGAEAADRWATIKQLGKKSFMNWQATGTSSFMQKEILTNKLRAFADFAMSNPNTAPLIDARELLEQTWDCMEIGRESPILKDEAEEKVPPQAQQKMQQMQEQMKQMGEALNAAHEEVKKFESQEAVKMEELRIKDYEADTKRLVALGGGMTPEQVQALVMQTLADAFAQPPQEMAPAEPEMPMEPEPAMPEQQPDMGMGAPEPMAEQMPGAMGDEMPPEPAPETFEQPDPGFQA